MVPGESVVDADQAGIRWNIGTEVRRLSPEVEKEIRIAEVGEVRRPKRIRRNHVKQLFLDWIGHGSQGAHIFARVWVWRSETPHRNLETPRQRIRAGRG